MGREAGGHPPHDTHGTSKSSREAAISTKNRSCQRKLKVPFPPQNPARGDGMKRILAKIALVALAATVPVTASAQAALEGRWANPKRSVIVNVSRCGDALCGIVGWASAR